MRIQEIIEIVVGKLLNGTGLSDGEGTYDTIITVEKKVEYIRGERDMQDKNNPCLTCYFDWKDYCGSDRRKACEEAKKVKDSESKLVFGRRK